MNPHTYEILGDCDREELVAMVRDFISQGWEPQGGLAIRHDGLIIQAMVKKPSKAEEDRKI